MNKTNKASVISRQAMIAAIYTVVSVCLSAITYGPVQIRISESLTLLPVFAFGNVWGVTIGCFLTNLIGFFTGAKPPEVTDVKAYNRTVSILWFVVAIVFELMGVPFLFLEQNSPYFIFIMLFTMPLVIGMAIAYLQIERKYKK